MKTIQLKNKINFHPNTNGGRTLLEAYKLIGNRQTLFMGITLFRGLGLDAGMLNANRIEIYETTQDVAGLRSPLIFAEIKNN